MQKSAGIAAAVCSAVLVSLTVYADPAGTVFDKNEIESLPISNRDIRDISRLEPDVAESDRSFESGSLSLSGLRGEGGVFPTAGILGKDELSADYSVYFFDNDTDVVNNNFEISFGLSDSVEIGLAGNVTRVDTKFQDDTYYATGPALKWSPIATEVYQLTVGGAVRFGDAELERNQMLFTGSYRLYEGDANDWVIRAVTLHAGMMQEWFDDGDVPDGESDSLRGFASIALAFANNWKAVFEAGTKDNDFDENNPYSLALAVPATIQFKSEAIELEVVPSIVEDGSGTGPSIQMAIRIRR